LAFKLSLVTYVLLTATSKLQIQFKLKQYVSIIVTSTSTKLVQLIKNYSPQVLLILLLN